MSYQGPERRRHKVYVTQNTEYHFEGEVCVAVRDRARRSWLLDHQALDRKLSGCVRFHKNGDAYPCLDRPRRGDALFFGSDGPDVITSAIGSIGRPPKELVLEYPF